MKYIIIVAIISIAGTVSNISSDEKSIPVEYIDFENPIIITAKV